MKIKLVIIHFIFIMFSISVLGQNNIGLHQSNIEEAFVPSNQIGIDTIFYPFYQGIQMIEIDYIGYWDRKIYFLEQSQPRAMSYNMMCPMPLGNVFLFRDTTGAIVKAFNTKKSLEQLTKHFESIPLNFKHNASILNLNHSSQNRSEGIWYQSPQPSFNFPGYYKVSTGVARLFKGDHYAEKVIEDTKGIKFGLIDSFGNMVLPLLYDEIFPCYGKLLVQKNSKWGIIDYKQKEIVPLKYDQCKVDIYDPTIAQDKPKNIFFQTLKKEGKNTKEYTYDARYLVQKNKTILLSSYDEIGSAGIWSPENAHKTYDNRYIYVTKNGKRGLLNASYEEVIPPLYEFFDYHKLSQGLFRVSKDGKFGFWDENFKEIIPLQYDYVENFGKDKTAIVFKNRAFYSIDIHGKKQTENNKIPLWEIGHLGLLIDPNYVSVNMNEQYGILDTSSNTVILPIKYHQSLKPIELNRFLSKNEPSFMQKKWVFIGSRDLYGEILFHNNKIIVKNENNYYGVIDSSFRVSIDFKYDSLQAIAYNLKYLIYTNNGKQGIIDFSGKNTLSTTYDAIRYDMHHKLEWDICKVRKNGKWGVVDFEDNVLVPCTYDSIRFLGHWDRPREKLWVVNKGNKYGVVNSNNEIFIPFEYDGISHLAGKILWVHGKDKKRYKVILKE